MSSFIPHYPEANQQWYPKHSRSYQMPISERSLIQTHIQIRPSGVEVEAAEAEEAGCTEVEVVCHKGSEEGTGCIPRSTPRICSTLSLEAEWEEDLGNVRMVSSAVPYLALDPLELLPGPRADSPVFTFGNQGFGQPRRRQAHPAAAGTGQESTGLIALLPVIILCVFALLSQLPSMFNFTTPDPQYSFEATPQYSQGRSTWNWNVPYYVNEAEWTNSEIWKTVPDARKEDEKAAMYSSKVRGFERSVESVYAGRLRSEVSSSSRHSDQSHMMCYILPF